MALNDETNAVTPMVTVAMPVYNGGRHLRLAVLSIVKQTFASWELLIIDDGSTDNSLETIADIKDRRIQILRDGKNRGLAARLNEAIDRARGRYLARMDQDDFSFPERFARQLKALESDPLLDMTALRALAINNDNQVTGIMPCPVTDEAISARPWCGFYLPHPTWMGRIEWFRKFRYRDPGPYYCEDQELLLRSYEESRFGVIREPLFAYRVRNGVQWRKLIKTRLTLLSFQLNTFLSKRLLVFTLFAVVTFAGRSALDVLRAAGIIRYPISGVQDKEILNTWRNLLISMGEKTVGMAEIPSNTEQV